MTNQVVSRIGTAFPKDPRIVIKEYIEQNWGQGNITVQKLDSIKVDTKFGGDALTKETAIIVEKMPTLIKPSILGGSRSYNTATYRIQIVCRGHSAINNKYATEQELERIVNAKPINIQTVKSSATGIDDAWIDDFEEISVDNDAIVSKAMTPAMAPVVARSYAIIRLHYQKEAA